MHSVYEALSLSLFLFTAIGIVATYIAPLQTRNCEPVEAHQAKVIQISDDGVRLDCPDSGAALTISKPLDSSTLHEEICPLSVFQDLKTALDAACLIPLYYKRGPGYRHSNKVPLWRSEIAKKREAE